MSEEIKELNTLQRLIGVITKPGATFKDIDQKPALLFPILFVLGLQLIITLATLPKTLEYTLIVARKLPTFQPSMESLFKISAIVGAVFSALLMPVIIWLIVSGLLKLFTVFTGDDGTFKNIFAVNIFAYVPSLIGGVVKAIIIAFTNPENIKNIQTSLALLLPTPTDVNKPGVLYTLLSSFDFFTIWNLILVSLGLAVVLKVSNKKTAIMVFGIFLFFALLGAGVVGLLSKIPVPAA